MTILNECMNMNVIITFNELKFRVMTRERTIKYQSNTKSPSDLSIKVR